MFLVKYVIIELEMCSWQVLALVFIRKLLDVFFTKRELSWLDDLMPESKKKKLEDAEREVSFTICYLNCNIHCEQALAIWIQAGIYKVHAEQKELMKCTDVPDIEEGFKRLLIKSRKSLTVLFKSFVIV